MIRDAKSLKPQREIGPKDVVGVVITFAADTRWRGMEGINMKLSRKYSLVLGLAAVLSQACGGDTSPTGGGGGNSGSPGATGAGGSQSAAGTSTCTPTKCAADPQFKAHSQAYCDAFEAGPCGAEFKAQYTCSLAHDKCNSSNSQDYDVVRAACMAEFAALDKCNGNSS